MLLTIFCCISTALTVFCVLNRINKRTIELAVHAAVHEARKDFHERNSAMITQLATKERELNKAREMVKLHEAVPTLRRPEAPATPTKASQEELRKEGLDMFAMSRPFTDTSYNDLLAVSDVVKVEPAAM
jgi:hypothetical protein